MFEKIRIGSRGQSILSQRLDRVGFVGCLLGGVVALVALGVLVERFRLTSLGDGHPSAGLIGTAIGICTLSLACFLMLRRMAHQWMAKAERDRQRLASLLTASTSFSNFQEPGDVLATAANGAREIADARAAYVFTQQDEEPPTLAGAVGRDALELFASLEESLEQLAHLVLDRGVPAIQGRGDRRRGDVESALSALAAVPIPSHGELRGVLVAIQTESRRTFDAAQMDSLATLAGLASVAIANAELRDTQRNFFAHVTDILITALDGHLDYYRGHGRRVAHYASLIARELRLDEKGSERLHFAALLHDIGMLRIDGAARNDPKACRRHCLHGFRMLDPIRLWKPIAPIVLHHHEWWDGAGYPTGLAGDGIPYLSRIISVCDALDAMTSSTSYKMAIPLEEAVRRIEDAAGTQFDPQVARAISAIVRRGDLESSLA